VAADERPGSRRGPQAGSSRDRGGPRRGGPGHGAGRTGSRGGDRAASARGSARRRTSEEPARTSEQQRYDGPELPEDITGRELDRRVRQQLRSLPDKLALRIARHLVAAGRILDTDPETAYQHTLAARSRASRLAVVREACGEAAYLAGHYAEALTELRAARRMNGSPDYLPVMADCERALGRPDRALTLAKDEAVARMRHETRIEMMIVASGARLDLGQPEVAAAMLDGKDLRRNEPAPWLARLRYAYASALLAADRGAEALEWFHRAAAVDATSVTDAAERVLELEGLVVTDAAEPEEGAEDDQVAEVSGDDERAEERAQDRR
jgi:tetratricopeptide (TPR) repeat protein